MKFENKVVLVVGATSGIGAAAAEHFAAEGAEVIVSGRRAEKGQAVVDGIIAKGGKAEYMKLDMRVIEEQKAVIAAVVEKYGKLDVLVCNGGIACLPGLEAVTEEAWDDVHNTNLRGAFFMFLNALPELKKTKGNVVFTSSISGLHASAANGAYAYAAAKAGLSQLVKLIAIECGPDGIRANAIAPGLTKTEILANVPEEYMSVLADAVPLKIVAEAEDQANMIVFLASDEARFITGQTVIIDGGATL